MPVVFLSALVARRGFVPPGGKEDSYAREKLRNEQSVSRLTRRTGRQATILRLGHGCGEYQPISEEIRGLIASARPDRHANPFPRRPSGMPC